MSIASVNHFREVISTGPSALSDAVIVGGGIIGLSVAYELSVQGRTVTLLDRAEIGRESSWAGAGILTPACPSGARDPLDRLRAGSLQLLAEWSDRLREETGIDNGYRRCGGLRIAFDPEGAEALEQEAEGLKRQGVVTEELSPAHLARLEPELSREVVAAFRTPEEAQLRNPWHLKALAVACRRRGARLLAGSPALGFEKQGSRILGVRTNAGPVRGGMFVVAAGAWTSSLLGPLGLTVDVRPIRGQIVLLDCPLPPLRHIVWSGSRYLVPRPDGRVLVGSTEEDAGFDIRPTAHGVRELLDLSCRLVPSLSSAPFATAWAGLRPATSNRLPLLGRAPGYENLFLASGHFRAGVELSAGSAVALVQSLLGGTPFVPLDAFAPSALGPQGPAPAATA